MITTRPGAGPSPRRPRTRPVLSRWRICITSAIMRSGRFPRALPPVRAAWFGETPTSGRTNPSSSAAIWRRWFTPPRCPALSGFPRRRRLPRRALTACGSPYTNPTSRGRLSLSGRWGTAGSTWPTARAPRGPRATSMRSSPMTCASRRGKNSTLSWTRTATTRMTSSSGAPPWPTSTIPTTRPTTRRWRCRKRPSWRMSSRSRIRRTTTSSMATAGGWTRPAAASIRP